LWYLPTEYHPFLFKQLNIMFKFLSTTDKKIFRIKKHLTFRHTTRARRSARIQEVEVVGTGWRKREGNMARGTVHQTGHHGQY